MCFADGNRPIPFKSGNLITLLSSIIFLAIYISTGLFIQNVQVLIVKFDR